MKRFLALAASAVALLAVSVCFAQDAAPTLSVPPSALDSDIFSVLMPLLAHYPKMGALIALMATLRVLMKPLFVVLEARVKADPAKAAILAGYERNAPPVLKGFAHLVDLLTSIKLPVLDAHGGPSSTVATLVCLLGMSAFLFTGCASAKNRVTHKTTTETVQTNGAVVREIVEDSTTTDAHTLFDGKNTIDKLNAGQTPKGGQHVGLAGEGQQSTSEVVTSFVGTIAQAFKAGAESAAKSAVPIPVPTPGK